MQNIYVYSNIQLLLLFMYPVKSKKPSTSCPSNTWDTSRRTILTKAKTTNVVWPENTRLLPFTISQPVINIIYYINNELNFLNLFIYREKPIKNYSFVWFLLLFFFSRCCQPWSQYSYSSGLCRRKEGLLRRPQTVI